jgi:enoyl reductase-like protein
LIAERFAKFVHGGIEAVIEIYEGICRPKACPQILAAYDGARLIEQHSQDGKWLILHT